jgi:hypothetical protein
MSKRLILQLFLFIAIIFVINWLLIVPFNVFPQQWLIACHLIFSLLLIIVIVGLILTIRYYIGLAGYTFIGMMFVKAFVVFVYLAIFNASHGKQMAYVFNFSIIYLLYLFFSIYLGLQLLKDQKPK